MPHDATERLIAVLEGAPEYFMDFMADFGGDPSDYIELAEGEEIDFPSLTPAQLGNAIRQGVELVPPPGLPEDFDLTEVDWASAGARLDQILASAIGGM